MPRVVSRLLAYFLVCYALSWFGHLGNWLWPSGYWPLPMNPLGPLLAAPIVLWAFDGGAGVRAWFWRMLRFRAPLWVYGAAFAIPLAIIIASVGLAILIGTPHGPLPTYSPLEFVIYAPVVLLFGPLPEEPGFRGFGQYELQESTSALVAALVIGFGVLIWHLPLLLLGEIPLPIAAVLIAVSVVYAWLYVSGGSIWPLVLLHWVQNYFGGGFFGEMFTPEHGRVWTAFLAGLYTIWAVLLVWKFGTGLGRKPAVLLPSNPGT
ncbi:MAG: type II CAAX endopeptidase family protein [Pseudorhodobacter sp.]|nr:type II CAAX endopeptidase family protein [Pseudorhodobacter sp.]